MKIVTRVGQLGIVLMMGAYYLLVAFNNVLDYGTNFNYVKHVMSMDSIAFDPHVAWHAITSPALHHLGYVGIIVWEAAAGILCSVGVLRMGLRLTAEEFHGAKAWALAGLWLGALLWGLAFITVGGEWFMMWESSVWNGEMPAFRMFTVNGIALLLVYFGE
jgi:predicted small integral membrane protein